MVSPALGDERPHVVDPRSHGLDDLEARHLPDHLAVGRGLEAVRRDVHLDLGDRDRHLVALLRQEPLVAERRGRRAELLGVERQPDEGSRVAHAPTITRPALVGRAAEPFTQSSHDVDGVEAHTP
jgi:hypothetical protein